MVRITLTSASIVAAAAAAGYLLYYNPESVELRLGPTAVWQAPLALIILASFLVGVGAAMLVSFAAKSRDAVRAWRKRRAANRERRRQERKELGMGLAWLGEHDRARNLLGKALDAAPQDLSAFLLFAKTYLDEGDFERARAFLQEGLDSRGADARLLYLLGEAHKGLGDLAAATDAWKRALALAPKSIKVKAALRDAYIEQKRWKEAAALQEECLFAARRANEYAAAQGLLLGLRFEAALAQNSPRDTQAALRAILRKEPDFEPARVSLGEALLALGKKRAAERVWKRALRRSPRGGVVDKLEKLMEESGRLERLDSVFRRYLSRHEEDAALRLFYARYLIKTDRPGRAKEALEALPERHRGSTPALVLRAQAEAKLGTASEAARLVGGVLASATIYPFCCARCKRSSPEWLSRCPGCLAWGTMRSFLEHETPS